MYIKSFLFEQFPEIIFGFSTKLGLGRTAPFWFNLSNSVGDEREKVEENRNHLFNTLGLNSNFIALQKQIHGDQIEIISDVTYKSESDAMITKKEGIGLAVSSADCAPIFIYDRSKKVIAAVHSGWRGTQKKILEKVLFTLENRYDSAMNDLFVYIGPSISSRHYEVGKEFLNLFDEKYFTKEKDKLYLDVADINYDILLEKKVPAENIQKTDLCSFEISYLHSYRRDKDFSGRALGVIAMRSVNEK